MQLRRELSRVEYPELTPVWIAVFIDMLELSVLIPLLPTFSAQYGAPPSAIGLLLSTNAVFGFFPVLRDGVLTAPASSSLLPQGLRSYPQRKRPTRVWVVSPARWSAANSS